MRMHSPLWSGVHVHVHNTNADGMAQKRTHLLWIAAITIYMHFVVPIGGAVQFIAGVEMVLSTTDRQTRFGT